MTVLLSGEGADELAGGYLDYIPYRTRQFLAENCGETVKEDVRSFVRDIKRGRTDEHCAYMLADYAPEGTLEKRLEMYRSFEGSFFEKYRKYLFKYHLVGLLERQNKVCMANSIENRVPFLDNEFVEFIFSLPEDILFRLNQNEVEGVKQGKLTGCYTGKYILKRISADFYGEEFAFHKKQTMQVPLLRYMQTKTFKDYVDTQIWPELKNRGIVNAGNFRQMFNNMTPRNVMDIWYCINSEIWCQLFLDGRRPLWG